MHFFVGIITSMDPDEYIFYYTCLYKLVSFQSAIYSWYSCPCGHFDSLINQIEELSSRNSIPNYILQSSVFIDAQPNSYIYLGFFFDFIVQHKIYQKNLDLLWKSCFNCLPAVWVHDMTFTWHWIFVLYMPFTAQSVS